MENIFPCKGKLSPGMNTNCLKISLNRGKIGKRLGKRYYSPASPSSLVLVTLKIHK